MSDESQTACRPDSPLMLAWEAYQKTPEFANSKKWVQYPSDTYIQGSLWAVFSHGFFAGVEKAAKNIENAALVEDVEVRKARGYIARHVRSLKNAT
jgi:hypothetical protein